MSLFLNRLSEGCVDFEKCGDVVVSPKDNMIGMFCHFCCDIYTNLSEFLHHLQWVHSDVLAFTKEHNVYSMEELLSLPAIEDDAQSQANSSSSSDSGIPADVADATGATCGQIPTLTAINENILNALAAYDVEFDKLKASKESAAVETVLHWQAEVDKCLPTVAATMATTEQLERDVLAEVQAMLLEDEEKVEPKIASPQNQAPNHDQDHGIELQQMLQAAGLQDIQLENEQSEPDKQAAEDIIIETPIKDIYCKVNFTEKEIEAHISKPARRPREAVKRYSEKPLTTCDLKSYAIARSARKREQQQRLSYIKKRIFRSLESEPTKPIRMPIKKVNVKRLNKIQVSHNSQPSIQDILFSDKSMVAKTNEAEHKIPPKQTENISIQVKTESNVPSIEQAKENEAKELKKSLEHIQTTEIASMPKTMIKKKNSALAKMKSLLKPTKSSSLKPVVEETAKNCPIKPTENTDKEKEFIEPSNNIKAQPKPIHYNPPKLTPITEPSIIEENKNKNIISSDENAYNKHNKISPVLISKVEILPKLNLKSDSSQPAKTALESYLIPQQTDSKSTTLLTDKVQQSQPESVKMEPLKQIVVQSPKQNMKRLHSAIIKTPSSLEVVKEKRTKIDHYFSDKSSMNSDLNDGVVDFRQKDLKTTELDSDSLMKLAETNEKPKCDAYENILNQVVAEHELEEQKPTVTTVEANELESNATPKDNVREDMKLLKLVGLPIVIDSSHEDLETIEYVDALRLKAAKFSKLFRFYDTAWLPKRFNSQFTQKILKEIAMLTEDVNRSFKINLNVSELKRILNLINGWHANHIDLKFFKKVTLSSTIDHYLELFAFLPKINRCLFYCEWCEESFVSKFRYEKHRMIHQCEFFCPHCKRGFKKRGYLVKHIRTMHSKEH